MWKKLVTLAAFGLLTSCGSSDQVSNPPFESASSKDVGYLLDFENNEPCQNNDIDDAMSSIHNYNLSSLNLDGYGGEGYGSFNVSKEILQTEDGSEYVSYFIPLTGTWHDSGLNILGVIAATCAGACGYWDVTYYFKEDAYTLLNSLKKMNIKNINSLRVNQELDIGANDYEEGIFFSRGERNVKICRSSFVFEDGIWKNFVEILSINDELYRQSIEISVNHPKVGPIF